VERSGIARWSLHYSPPTIASLPLGTSHHRSAVRLGSVHDRSWPRQRDPRPHHAGGGPKPATVTQSLLPLARGAPRLLAATAQSLIQDDRGDLATLAGAGAVTEEEAGPVRTASSEKRLRDLPRRI
jgi:hypothetical protein